MKNQIFIETNLLPKLISLINPQNILFVTYSTEKIDSNLQDHRKTKTYNLIFAPKHNIIISPHQFMYLTTHALLPEYRLIIFQLEHTSPELISSFRNFYYEPLKFEIFKKNICIDKRTRVIIFVKNIMKKDDIYLHAKIEDEFTEENIKDITEYANNNQISYFDRLQPFDISNKKWNFILINSDYDPSIEEYLKIRNLYISNEKEMLESLEAINFKLAIKYLKVKYQDNAKEHNNNNNDKDNNNDKEHNNNNNDKDNNNDIDTNNIKNNDKNNNDNNSINNDTNDNNTINNNIIKYNKTINNNELEFTNVKKMLLNKSKYENLISIIKENKDKRFKDKRFKIVTKLIKNKDLFIETINSEIKSNISVKRNRDSLITINSSDDNQPLKYEDILILYDISEHDFKNINPAKFSKFYFFIDFEKYSEIGVYQKKFFEMIDDSKISLDLNSEELNSDEDDSSVIENKVSTVVEDHEKIFKILSKNIKWYKIHSSAVTIAHKYSVSIIVHILQMIKLEFDSNFLFFRDLTPIVKFFKDDDIHFRCSLKLPPICKHEIFEKEFVSEQCLNKKEAHRQACILAIKNMIGFAIDDHLIPIQKNLVLNNEEYYRRIYEIYHDKISFEGIFLKNGKDLLKKENAITLSTFANIDQINHEILNRRLIQLHEEFKSKNPYYKNPESSNKYSPDFVYPICSGFKKKFRVCLSPNIHYKEEKLNENASKIYRIQPKCLSHYPSEFFIYSFKDYDNEFQNDGKTIKSIGIATGSSFIETATYLNVEVKFLQKITFTKEQMEIIFFFQVLFFGLHCRKKSKANNFEYCYLVIPIKNDEIDWDLLEYHFNQFIVSEVYDGDQILLEENLLFNPFNKFFYCYEGPSDLSLDTPFELLSGNKTTYRKYFEKKYSVKLERTSGKNLLFKGSIHCGKIGKAKMSDDSINILSTEIMHITSIKKNYFNHFIKFKKYLNFFDNLS
ncbi:hypothetical protein DMUE_4245, partial [Dictyocoela muelleri]